MKKSMFFQLLFGCLLIGCTPSLQQPKERSSSSGTLLWSEEFTHGTYEVRTTQSKLSLTSLKDDRQSTRTIDKPNNSVAFLSGETIVIGEPKIQLIDAVVILDEELATQTTQIEITRRDNNVMIQANESGHGTLFFIDPQMQPSQQIVEGNGSIDAVGIAEDGIGVQTIICYRLIDENNIVIYEDFQIPPDWLTENVPNCEGIPN